MYARAVLLLVLVLVLPVRGVFQPANRTELKAGVELYMRDPEEAMRIFGGEIGEWDVSRVKRMDKMFCGSDKSCSCGDLCSAYQAFNEPLGNWNTSAVVSMGRMFDSAFSYDQALGGWDTSAVESMLKMFSNALSFDQALGGWNVSSTKDMQKMFERASSYNQDLTSWQVSPSTNTNEMFRDTCAMEPDNLPPLQDFERDYFLEKACASCQNCPPNGGPCLNGYSREVDMLCSVCPEETTELGGSCKTCPSSSFTVTLYITTFAVLALLGFAIARYAKKHPELVPKFDLGLKRMIQIKQLGAAVQFVDAFAKLSSSLPDWFAALGNIFSIISVPLLITLAGEPGERLAPGRDLRPRLHRDGCLRGQALQRVG